MRAIRIFRKGLNIWMDLIANNDPTALYFTLFFWGFLGTISTVLMLSFLPGTVLTALGVQFLTVGSLTALGFLAAIMLRIMFEWFAYTRYK
jgi:hypothetical protein